MTLSPRNLWRPLRYLLLIASAGAVLAADNTWVTKLRFDFKDSFAWLSNFYPAEEKAAVLPAIVEATAPNDDAALGMDRLINGLLFSRPSTSWLLDSANAGSTSSAQLRPPIVSVTTSVAPSSALETATFSSGYVAPSSWVSAPQPNAPLASGNWISNASGNWSTAANWQGGTIADGAGNSAHFDLLDITTDVTVNVDTPRTIGSIFLGDTNATNRYTISGSTLTFDSGDPNTASVIQQTSTSAGDTIAASILTSQDLDVNNFSTTSPLSLTGPVAPNGATSPIVWFNNTTGATGNINVSGNLTDGASGTLNVVVVNGTVTLSGANTYTGFTEVDGGTLLVNGNNSGTGTVYVYPTGTLGGTGTIGGNVYSFGGAITGATETTVGTLTLLGNVNLSTGEGDGGTYLANLSGSLSDLLAITGQLILGAGTTLDIQGTADGTTTYVLATFAAHDDVFDMVMGVPTGYALVYNATDLELVPIPEPATWLGGAFALGALALAQRRKLRTFLVRGV